MGKQDHTPGCSVSDPLPPKGMSVRLEPIAPQDLTPTQKPLYLDMKKGIAGHFNELCGRLGDEVDQAAW